MSASAVVTVRIDAELLSALKDKVRRDGRTLSAAIVQLVRNDVQPKRTRPRKRRPTIGMFSDFEAPDLEDLVQLRHSLGARLMPSPASKRKRR
jgi:metal-responsive CopG/Arc/MetJ family transcriptional regulator